MRRPGPYFLPLSVPPSVATFGRQPFVVAPSTPLQSWSAGQSVCSVQVLRHCSEVVPSEGFPQMAPAAHWPAAAPDCVQVVPMLPPSLSLLLLHAKLDPKTPQTKRTTSDVLIL